MIGILIVYCLIAFSIVVSIGYFVHRQFCDYEKIIEHQNRIIADLIEQIKNNELQ